MDNTAGGVITHDALALWLVVGVFAAFGATAKVLNRGWRRGRSSQAIGQIMGSVFASLIVGMGVQPLLPPETISPLLAITGIAAWSGVVLLEGLARWIERKGVKWLGVVTGIPEGEDNDAGS